MRKEFFVVFALLAVGCNAGFTDIFSIPGKILNAFGDVFYSGSEEPSNPNSAQPQNNAQQPGSEEPSNANSAQPQNNAPQPGPSELGSRNGGPEPLGVAGDYNYQSFGRATNNNHGTFNQNLSG